MRLLAILFAISLCACGTEKPEENPTTCELSTVPEGFKFRCVDKNGVESVGLVKHGDRGASGQPGDPGKPGEQGEGLKVESEIFCQGSIESWMENATYEIDFQITSFESDDKFLASTVKLVRDGEVINQRNASGFFVGGITLSPSISDGLFVMRFDGVQLHVTSQGEISEMIQCKAGGSL